MTTTPSSRLWLARHWGGPPLVLQILLLLLGGLVVAQFVTLLLTVVLPPAPGEQRSLTEVAAALNGVAGEDRADRLERVVQAGPPDIAGPGWLAPDAPRRSLAALLGVRPSEVRLAFYTPLPLAGTTPLRKIALLPDDGARRIAFTGDGGARVILAQAIVTPPSLPLPPSGRRPIFTPPGGSLPTQIRPGGRGGPPRDGFPPGLAPGGRPPGTMAAASPGNGNFAVQRSPLIEVDPAGARAGTWLPGDGGAAIPPLLQGTLPATRATTPSGVNGALAAEFEGRVGQQSGIFVLQGPRGANGALVPNQLLPRYTPPPVPDTLALPRGTIALPLGMPIPAPAPPTAVPVTPVRPAVAPPPIPAPPLILPPVPDVAPAPPPIVQTRLESLSSEPAIPLAPRARGLFGLAPAPFVEGDFVAALKLGDGRWAVVQPAPEPFPNAWQRRVLLWFAVAFALVAPFGLLFARALVRPLTGFAEAAEQLGRDPAAMVGRLDGPAEVGRAARAFNLMQSRLKSFVDDRTAMVGAISHDLRTPLTRLRFRIEEVDDDGVRDGMIEEVAEMEAMIASVLSFIRDASTPGARERIDLRLLVEDVCEDAAMVGGDVAMAPAANAAVPVEVDPLGMRRLLANLVENAVKYGDRARVRIGVVGGEAVASIVDDGPGVPDNELERAFEPFYRAANARGSDKRGSGLGLAVCRSIARAHGGDVRLRRDTEGFVAELRVPLALAT